MRRFWIRRGLRFLAFAILFVGLIGYVVMTLWNALLPAIVGVSTITFWQAIGLLVLSRILFGGFGWRGGYGYGRRGFGPGRAEWKQKMAERWQKMTPEQREQMKAQWRNRCGGWGRGRWNEPQPKQSDQQGPTTTAV
ncbi:hypothetical protein ACFSUS_19665 [Spirosoma soli]|uniref:DUF1682 domain-containing protein n=1 Tax=Spirosoma soli TaxID=1770529 RepID=A0ABW5M833_9BACT